MVETLLLLLLLAGPPSPSIMNNGAELLRNVHTGDTKRHYAARRLVSAEANVPEKL